MLSKSFCIQPPAAEPVEEDGDELQKGWQFVKDRAGELDTMANSALDEAGAAIQVLGGAASPLLSICCRLIPLCCSAAMEA